MVYIISSITAQLHKSENTVVKRCEIQSGSQEMAVMVG